MKGRARDLPTCDLSSAVDGWCTGESPVAARAGREERVARTSEIPTRVDAHEALEVCTPTLTYLFGPCRCRWVSRRGQIRARIYRDVCFYLHI